MFFRSGVNDWERGSITKWKHQMNLPSDAFFDSCKTLRISRANVPQNVSVELLGYSSTDNINVKSVLISLSSPTWISHPLEFQAKDIGWTSTNLQTYIDGGLHVISQLHIKNPGTTMFKRHSGRKSLKNVSFFNQLVSNSSNSFLAF